MSQRPVSVYRQIYSRLLGAFGPQSWWPGDTSFEVIVGAILTQNTNWGNVEKAIARLKRQRCLTPRAMKNISTKKLAACIRPAGYFNVKARRLKNFIAFLFDEYNGSLQSLGRERAAVLRGKLLKVNGIGPETADSIVLYAFNKPAFVIDAYTKRFMVRHNLAGDNDGYDQLRNRFTRALRPEIGVFNEYHALIVRLGKEYCRPKALCAECPLNDIHYSLKNKCQQCHRALPDPKTRKLRKGRLMCVKCRKKQR